MIKVKQFENFELQTCFIPQMKAEIMHNSYSDLKNRIFKEKTIFF